MATLFDPPKAQAPPPAPTLSQAQVDANNDTANMLQSNAVGEEQTVLTTGLKSTQATTQKAALLSGLA